MEFLSRHASDVAKLLDLIVGNVNDRGLLTTLPVIETLIQVFSNHSRDVYVYSVLKAATTKDRTGTNNNKRKKQVHND